MKTGLFRCLPSKLVNEEFKKNIHVYSLYIIRLPTYIYVCIYLYVISKDIIKIIFQVVYINIH